VVGGLVQQQHVGVREQQAAERDAALLAAGQVGDLRVPGRQAQGVGRLLELGFHVVPVGGVDDGLEPLLLGRELVEIRVGLGVGRVHGVELGLGVLDLAEAFLHRLAARCGSDRAWAPAPGSRS
jgi:hypothetical protein